MAIYINSDLKCRRIEQMTTVMDDLMECITVEIEMEKIRNIVVTCVYRTPGSNVERFKESMEEIMNGLNESKTYIICGDFNIDLLNASIHKTTSDFLDSFYSTGLYPLITTPSRITLSCATLIDNIFVNIMENNVKSGLIINDISDHLPIFLTYDCQIKRKKKENSCRFARVRTDEAINTFKNDLLREVWRGVYVEEVNDAYEAFRKIYLSLYDSYCPIIQCKYKHKYDAKPWITKGLLNACKKKNKLYKRLH